MYEPGGFVPLAQASQSGYIGLHAQPVYEGRYDIDRDPLWVSVAEPVAFAQIGYYQCDHLGTPQEITDAQGEVAWSAHYKAWGEAKEAISTAARRAGISNPLRFQGQYHDHETGLHYNRNRYYDPATGRYLSKDPIGLAGGFNYYQYANANPVGGIDPLGLTSSPLLYRGVSAKHPALEKAKQGIVCPANSHGNLTPEEHAAGGQTGKSQYVSWTPNKDIALDNANKDGPGGVLLSVPKGPPQPGDSWSWGWTHWTEWGEPEMLQEGTRTGVKVSHL
ncbi:hypothetical protein BSFA1_37490 [Burkholderia sp. SFA1]|nr:hypothetical protein BSFA1_37490 [Burkholderia sp. SFA1]